MINPHDTEMVPWGFFACVNAVRAPASATTSTVHRRRCVGEGFHPLPCDDDNQRNDNTHKSPASPYGRGALARAERATHGAAGTHVALWGNWVTSAVAVTRNGQDRSLQGGVAVTWEAIVTREDGILPYGSAVPTVRRNAYNAFPTGRCCRYVGGNRYTGGWYPPLR